MEDVVDLVSSSVEHPTDLFSQTLSVIHSPGFGALSLIFPRITNEHCIALWVTLLRELCHFFVSQQKVLDPLALSRDSTRLSLSVQVPYSLRVMRWAAR